VGPEDGSLSSPVVTSYRLPIVTIGLSLIVFAVLRLITDRRTTDGRTEGKRRQFYRPPNTKTLHWYWPIYSYSKATIHRSKERTVSRNASVWAPMIWSGSLSPGTRCDYKLRCRISIHALIRLSLDDEFVGRFRIIPPTHMHLSLNSPFPSTYTFNSLVFHSRVFSAPMHSNTFGRMLLTWNGTHPWAIRIQKWAQTADHSPNADNELVLVVMYQTNSRYQKSDIYCRKNLYT